MKITLNKSRYCIETAAKKKHERLVMAYFKSSTSGREKSIIEKQITALSYFLEKADFQTLRIQMYKTAAQEDNVTLIVPEHHKDIHLMVNQTRLFPNWKNK